MKRASARAIVAQIARADVRREHRQPAGPSVSVQAGELRAGLMRGELVLHYQPIVDLRSGECRRVEALLRWQHPRLGLLEPKDFLAIATPFLEDIALWVVESAARQWTEWRGRGETLGIGVNLAGPELRESGPLVEAMRSLGSGQLTFEVSPATFSGESERAALDRLSAAGARIALDGVGPEDAPGRVVAAHLDEIKISRALVRRASETKEALAGMRALVELARDYRLAAVAVGVEDRALRDVALSLGCELAQGYFVSRPLVPDRLGPWRRWVAGVALTGSLTLTTFAGIGKAASGGSGLQTPTLVRGVLPTACSLDIPSVAARSGIELDCVRGDRADLYVEDAVDPAVRDALSAAMDRDMATLEGDLGHAFSSRPAIYAFASRASFAFALQDIFGVRGPDAGLLAAANGGVTLPRQGAIVLNLQNVANDADYGIVRHELTHALVHQIVGVNVQLPAWFDEGLATLRERDGTAGAARGSAVALGILSAGKTTLGDLDDQTVWAQRNATLDGQAYSVAAEAVRLLEGRVSHDGLVRMLDAVAGGATFAAAYLDEAGETLADFTQAFPARLASELSDARIVQTARPDGVLWTLTGFTPNSVVKVNIDGAGYHLEYEVRTDKYGVHQGTFGATAPKGDYTLRATRGGTTITAVLRT
ncbi:MAG TPA: EAL domain-containing protein [Candidatus Limnocylindria bacterium]